MTKPRSLPCAAMASMASSRRAVSFSLLYPRFEANIGEPVTSSRFVAVTGGWRENATGRSLDSN